ncbi:response regulator [Sphingobium vermicomposti]|nr:response regulator [Sphingobium vermicomposti]
MFFGLVKGEARQGRRMKTIRSVLIVEDEPLVAFDNEHALEQAGYHVAATVEDYDHAVSVIEDDEVDIVIADIALHGDKTGIDVARHAHARGLPVLFVTGACPVDAVGMAVGCLSKPYLPRDLIAAINIIEARLDGIEPTHLPTGLRLFGQSEGGSNDQLS